MENGYSTKIELGGVYYFPSHYHREQMQVVDMFDDIDYNADPFETGSATYYKAVRVVYLDSRDAGKTLVLPLATLEKNALPVPSEKIERYYDTANNKERFALVPFALEVKSVEGDYIELEDGTWLRSLRDGRYVDDDTKETYSATYYLEGYEASEDCRACDVIYVPTGRYIKNGWHHSLTYWRG